MAVLGVIVIVAAILVTRSGDDAETAGGEVFLEAVAATGQDPFTEPLDPEPSTTTTASSTTVAAPAPPVAPVSLPTSGVTPPPGSPPYGGSGDDRVCDRERLVTFLTANQSQATAWAGVLGIAVGDIPTYVRSLTPTRLLYDTRVTNHGFANGRATTLQSVLQAGTAVLVDAAGDPVVRCRCGNPLLAPRPVSAPVYQGTPWPGFSPTALVSVNAGVTVTVVNTAAGAPPSTAAPASTATPTTPTTAPSTAPVTGPGATPSTVSTTATPTTSDDRPPGAQSDIEGLLAFLADCAPGAAVEVVDIRAEPGLPGTFSVRASVDGTEMLFVYDNTTGDVTDGNQAAAALLQSCGAVG